MTAEESPGNPGVERWPAALRHELLTPMNHIVGYAEMLLEEAVGQAAAELESIHRAGNRLTALLRQLFIPEEASRAAALRADIRASIQRIMADCDALQQGGNAAPEVRSIREAATTLLALLDGIPLPSATAAPETRPQAAADADFEAAGGAGGGLLLVVDDNENNRDMLSRRLRRLGYEVRTAENGEMALEMMGSDGFDLVLLDVMMPGMDGHEVLRRLKSDAGTRHVPVIMISALNEIESIVRGIELGAEDYLPKPFNPVLLKARVGACLEKKRLRDREVVHLRRIEEYNLHLEELVKEQVKDISRAQMGTIFALSNLAESRDPETGAHLARVQEYCRLLATRMGEAAAYGRQITPDFVETLVAASPLHDIGKVGIPDRILLKPGRLDEEEFAVMKTHTLLGAATLRAVDEKHPGNGFIRLGIEIVESHHEKWDGTGYPHGLAGEAIPLSARIMALADVYDALRSRRCYKPAYSHEESRGIILENRGRHFEPGVVDCFLECETEFEAVWRDLGGSEE
jgi:putative two-component system response regulator